MAGVIRDFLGDIMRDTLGNIQTFLKDVLEVICRYPGSSSPNIVIGDFVNPLWAESITLPHFGSQTRGSVAAQLDRVLQYNKDKLRMLPDVADDIINQVTTFL